MNSTTAVPIAQAAVAWSFVSATQDRAQTLVVELTALAQIATPGSPFALLARHCLTIATTLALEAGDVADAIH